MGKIVFLAFKGGFVASYGGMIRALVLLEIHATGSNNDAQNRL
ncbi:hypothetical protein [Bartonella senegalensis]|nr:hypothetical protein [Bartonella senegalensis]